MSAHVRDVFRAALNSASPLPYLETIGLVHDPKTLPSAFTTLEFPIAQAARIALGYPTCCRESGTVLVHVFGRSGQGDAQVLADAEALRPTFDQPFIDDVHLLGSHPPALVPSDLVGWLDVVVPVDYQWDYVVAAPLPLAI
jgi:hypothetical protein